jgi:hypothetical protein
MFSFFGKFFASIVFSITSLFAGHAASPLVQTPATSTPVGVQSEIVQSPTNSSAAENSAGINSFSTSSTLNSSASSSLRVPIADVKNLDNYAYRIEDGQICYSGDSVNFPGDPIDCTSGDPNQFFIEGADLATFNFIYASSGNAPVFDPPYAVDKNHVYCEGTVLVGADPATFTVTYADREPGESIGQVSDSIAKDKQHVYEVCSVDPDQIP